MGILFNPSSPVKVGWHTEKNNDETGQSIAQFIDQCVHGDEKRAKDENCGSYRVSQGLIRPWQVSSFFSQDNNSSSSQPEENPFPEDHISEELFECSRKAEDEAPES